MMRIRLDHALTVPTVPRPCQTGGHSRASDRATVPLKGHTVGHGRQTLALGTVPPG